MKIDANHAISVNKCDKQNDDDWLAEWLPACLPTFKNAAHNLLQTELQWKLKRKQTKQNKKINNFVVCFNVYVLFGGTLLGVRSSRLRDKR